MVLTLIKKLHMHATHAAKLQINTTRLMSVRNRIHHLGGTWHEYAPLNAWGVMIGLVSAGLILVGITGIYLWFKMHGERAIGIALLVANLGVCATPLVLIRTA
jgi:hypothetical protein